MPPCQAAQRSVWTWGSLSVGIMHHCLECRQEWYPWGFLIGQKTVFVLSYWLKTLPKNASVMNEFIFVDFLYFEENNWTRSSIILNTESSHSFYHNNMLVQTIQSFLTAICFVSCRFPQIFYFPHIYNKTVTIVHTTKNWLNDDHIRLSFAFNIIWDFENLNVINMIKGIVFIVLCIWSGIFNSKNFKAFWCKIWLKKDAL